MNRMNRAANKMALLALTLVLAGPAAADEKPLVDTGQLYVHGDLQENTCRMEMDSAWQEVDLGSTARAEVNPGRSSGETRDGETLSPRLSRTGELEHEYHTADRNGQHAATTLSGALCRGV